MKYAVEVGSGAMMYIPGFLNIGSGIRKLMGAGDTETIRRSRKPILEEEENVSRVLTMCILHEAV
jgi:hypothetical protein